MNIYKNTKIGVIKFIIINKTYFHSINFCKFFNTILILIILGWTAADASTPADASRYNEFYVQYTQRMFLPIPSGFTFQTEIAAPSTNPATFQQTFTDGSYAPTGRPTAVQFGGYTVLFTPQKYNLSDAGTCSVANVLAFKNGPKGRLGGSGAMVSFPHSGLISPAFPPTDPTFYSYILPTQIAATTYQNAIWLCIGGTNKNLKGSSYNIYQYTVGINKVDPVLEGTWTLIQTINLPGEWATSVASASVTNTDSSTAISYLTFFVASNNGSKSLRAYTLTGAATKFKENVLNNFSPATKVPPQADLDAVQTVDSQGKPMIALAWAVNSSVNNLNTPQQAMGIEFFDGLKILGDAPMLTGTGYGSGPNASVPPVPIPQSIRIAEGQLKEAAVNNIFGSTLQIFGNLNGRIARWEYRLTGPNGSGAWLSKAKPGSGYSESTPFAVDPKNTLQTNQFYPDFFAVTTISEPVDLLAGKAGHTPFYTYQNTIALLSCSDIYVLKNTFYLPVTTIHAYYYDSDQLYPYGIVNTLNPNAKKLTPVLTAGVQSPPRDLGNNTDCSSWLFVGAIKGVPPTLLPFSDGEFTDDETNYPGGGELEYQSENTSETSISCEYQNSFGFGFDGEAFGDFLKLEVQFKEALTSSHETVSSLTAKRGFVQNAHGTRLEQGYLFFAVPEVTGQIYRRLDPYQRPIALSALDPSQGAGPYRFFDVYMSTVTGCSINKLPYNMLNPEMDLEGYPGSHHYSKGISGNGIGWRVNDLSSSAWPAITQSQTGYSYPSSDTNFSSLSAALGQGTSTSGLKWSSSTVNEASSTLSYDIKATVWDLSTSISGEETSGVTNKYDKDTEINLSLSYDKRTGDFNGNSYSSYTVQPALFVANENEIYLCDFVPGFAKDNQTQTFRPFFVDYSVNNLISKAVKKPVFMTDIVPKTVNLGGSTFFHAAVNGRGRVKYLWYHDGKLVPGQTESSLIISLAKEVDAGSYQVRATDADGTSVSSAAMLTVLASPIAKGTFQDQVVAPGQTASFKSTVIGKGPLTYQWYVDRKPVKSATQLNFVVPAQQITVDGVEIAVLVTNKLGAKVQRAKVARDPKAAIDPGQKLFAGAGIAPLASQNVKSGNRTYNLVAMLGESVTARALPGTTTRIGFIDNRSHLTYVEFSGAGLVTVYVPNNTNYSLKNIAYSKGLADIYVENSNITTKLSIYSPDEVYPVIVHSLTVKDSQMGQIDASKVLFTGTRGEVGVIARQLHDVNKIQVGDIDAREAAHPDLIFGLGESLEIAVGSDLSQTNGEVITARGVGHVTFPDKIQNKGRFFYDLNEITDEITKK